jgi:hypothetical protein
LDTVGFLAAGLAAGFDFSLVGFEAGVADFRADFFAVAISNPSLFSK